MVRHSLLDQASQESRDRHELLRLVEKDIGTGGLAPPAARSVSEIRQHHHGGRGREPLSGFEHGATVAVRHLDVEDREIWSQVAHRHHRLRGALGLPDHRDLLDRREQRYQTLPHDRRVIHDQDVHGTRCVGAALHNIGRRLTALSAFVLQVDPEPLAAPSRRRKHLLYGAHARSIGGGLEIMMLRGTRGVVE